jgi:regulator of protease activity HflC (stomatin/prohibitin superfamily)
MRDDDLREEMKDVGPLGQSVALAFRFLFVGACVVAAGWLGSNFFRQVPPDSQAVVMRFGAVARIQGPGLLMALPRPLETAVILPAPARQMPLRIERFVEGASAGAATSGYDLSRDPRQNTGFLLTGDSNVVHLEAQLFYQVSDPVAYMIAESHVRPALQRLFIASAIAVVGRRSLDSILVARPEVAARASEAAERERFRADLVNEVNKRLADLRAADASLGITVSRADIVPSIPAGAKEGFDNVLTVTQSADTAVAQARTAAQFTTQEANSKKDHIATDATATAEEIVTNAKTQTASIAALAQQQQDMSRSMLMTRYFYDRIEPILKKAAGIDVVDDKGTVHTIHPGVYAAPNRRTNQ